MRCDEVQEELICRDSASEQPGAVKVHLAGCATCQRIAQLCLRIDEALTRGPVWAPPDGFATRVAARTEPVLNQPVAVDLMSIATLRRAASGLIVGGFAFLCADRLSDWLMSERATATLDAYGRFVSNMSDVLVTNATASVWAWAICSLLFGIWYWRRTLAS